MKLSGLPSTDADQAIKNAVAVLKSKKPRITDEEAVSIAHDMLVASVPSICAGAIQRVGSVAMFADWFQLPRSNARRWHTEWDIRNHRGQTVNREISPCGGDCKPSRERRSSVVVYLAGDDERTAIAAVNNATHFGYSTSDDDRKLHG